MLLSVALAACSASAEAPHPPSRSTTPVPGVTLELVRVDASRACCRVFTRNPGSTAVTVACLLQVLDPRGKTVYTAIIPPIPPGHRRSSGFAAPPGRGGHGVLDLPIDIAHDTYTAPCRPAAWHGGAPI